MSIIHAPSPYVPSFSSTIFLSPGVLERGQGFRRFLCVSRVFSIFSANLNFQSIILSKTHNLIQMLTNLMISCGTWGL